MNVFTASMEFLTALFGRFIDFLDSLVIVRGVTVLAILLAVIIILSVIGSFFRSKES